MTKETASRIKAAVYLPSQLPRQKTDLSRPSQRPQHLQLPQPSQLPQPLFLSPHSRLARKPLPQLPKPRSCLNLRSCLSGRPLFLSPRSCLGRKPLYLSPRSCPSGKPIFLSLRSCHPQAHREVGDLRYTEAARVGGYFSGIFAHTR